MVFLNEIGEGVRRFLCKVHERLLREGAIVVPTIPIGRNSAVYAWGVKIDEDAVSFHVTLLLCR
jgi:hypothetical protein